MLSRKFKAPRADDAKQWEKVRRLVEAGFRFESAYRWMGRGAYTAARYPAKLSEVDAFVAEFAPWTGGGGMDRKAIAAAPAMKQKRGQKKRRHT
jgi:hypothetical protein